MSFTESRFGLKETSIPLTFISFSIIRSNGKAGKQAKHENNSDSGKSQKQKDGRTDEKAEGRNRCAVEFCGKSFGSAPHAATNGSRLRIKKGRGSANLFLERSCVRDVHTIQSRLQSLR